MNYWLRDFAYRIEVTLAPFFVSAIAALLIAFFTVSFQALKASTVNPARSLNYE